MRVIQKFIVFLGERNGKQIWLAYDDAGRIGNAAYQEAFRYDTLVSAEQALQNVRRTVGRFPDAKVMALLVEEDD